MSDVIALTAPGPLRSEPDFSDWLSPILVKELRQGLKSRVFVGTFIAMQIIMIMTMGLRLLEQSSNLHPGGGGGFDAFFWAMLWLPMLVFMPARGLSAVSEEARGNTFDLVQLTRMTAFRIALGKWIALVAQTLLLTAAILPYAMVRYYFGGVDVMNDLAVIGHLLMASMVLTAAAVALSSASLAMRVLVLVFVAPTLVMAAGSMAIASFVRGYPGGMAVHTSMDHLGWWMLPLSTAIYVLVFLEFAAAKFAPPAENHSARKRAAALLLVLLLPLASCAGGPDLAQSVASSLLPLIAWVSIDALTETSLPLPSIYAPFARRGVLARCLGRLLYPGWTTAVPFLALVIGITALAAYLLPPSSSVSSTGRMEWVKSWWVVFFALISPLTLMMFFPRFKQRFWLYLFLQLFCGLLFAAVNIAANPVQGGDPRIFRWLAPFPTAALIAITWLYERPDIQNSLRDATTLCGALMLVILAPAMWREFRLFSRRERFVLDQNQNSEIKTNP